MGKDLLGQFRNKPADGGSTVLAGPTKVVYEAFKIADKPQRRLKIRPAQRAWERMTYGYLYHLSEDGIYGTQIALVYSFSVVIIKGHNLRELADAIDQELCEFVQAFDADRWDKPTDPKAAIVESITVHAQTTRAAAMDKARDEILAVQAKPLAV